MGSEVVKAVQNSNECKLVAAIDSIPEKVGIDVGEAVGIKNIGVEISSDFEATLCSVSQSNRTNQESNPAVLIDFTNPLVVYEHTRASIAYGVHPVIGTTGLTPDQIKDLGEFSEKASISAAIIPNFSIGMVLLQQAAAAASSFYENAELIELHHNQKLDAPSGTCIKTAELMEELGKPFNESNIDETETLQGCRGGKRASGLQVHSIRLPGLVAHQEVLFGAPGETYSLRHDTIQRSAYMPGVLLVIRKIRSASGLIYGLEKLI
tara:strand:- start:7227 stop:8021 length:795 start_codon:yes stop_codon:yes gene_type:complete